jgi:hypothetical protein
VTQTRASCRVPPERGLYEVDINATHDTAKARAPQHHDRPVHAGGGAHVRLTVSRSIHDEERHLVFASETYSG